MEDFPVERIDRLCTQIQETGTVVDLPELLLGAAKKLGLKTFVLNDQGVLLYRLSLAAPRALDHINTCWLQSEGLSTALAERINDTQMRGWYMEREDRLLDLENQARGLADALHEIRILRRN